MPGPQIAIRMPAEISLQKFKVVYPTSSDAGPPGGGGWARLRSMARHPLPMRYPSWSGWVPVSRHRVTSGAALRCGQQKAPEVIREP